MSACLFVFVIDHDWYLVYNLYMFNNRLLHDCL